MQDQLNKMLMDELLTEEQLKFYELTIKQFHNPHGTVHRHSMALLLGYRDLKAKVEEMQKALKQWENFAIYLTKITSCSMTKNEISHALNTFAQKGEPK